MREEKNEITATCRYQKYSHSLSNIAQCSYIHLTLRTILPWLLTKKQKNLRRNTGPEAAAADGEGRPRSEREPEAGVRGHEGTRG